MVYQADKGSSFDGEEIEAYLMLPFCHFKSPMTLKTFRKISLEMSSVGYSTFQVHPEFSYGDPTIPTHTIETVESRGLGGYWDMKSRGESRA